MAKIVAATFVDHKDEVVYPLGFTASNLDLCERIYLFSGNEDSLAWHKQVSEGHALKNRTTCVNLGLQIRRPIDFSSVQNACLQWMRAEASWDYVLFFQADIRMTAIGMKCIERFCDPSSGGADRPVLMIRTNHLRLHMPVFRTHFGTALIGRNSNGASFVGDAAYTESYWISTDSNSDQVWHALDVGYCAIEQYFRHIEKQAIIHGDTAGKALSRMFAEDRKGAIQKAIANLMPPEKIASGSLLMPIEDPDYRAFADTFGVLSERGEIENLIGEMRSRR